MSVRDKMNKNSSTTTGIAIAVLVLALVAVVWQFRPRGYQNFYEKIYYSNDDGKTWFADDRLKIPPYDKDGKQAVRAQVVRCGSDKPFVAYLSRYSERAKKAMEEATANGTLTGDMMDGYGTQTEVKRPGDAEWVPWVRLGETDIMNIKCPDGKTQMLPVYP